MDTTTTASTTALAPSVATDSCPWCGATLAAGAEHCPQCDWVRQPKELAGDSEVVKLAVMSLVPGLAHLYKGHVLMGGVILLIIGPAVLALALAVLPASFGTSLIFLPIFMAGVMLHAIQLPRKNAAAKIP